MKKRSKGKYSEFYDGKAVGSLVISGCKARGQNQLVSGECEKNGLLNYKNLIIICKWKSSGAIDIILQHYEKFSKIFFQEIVAEPLTARNRKVAGS